MRLKHIKDAEELIYNYDFVVKDSSYRGKWNDLFGNNNPINIEIGMGKGKFIYGLALKNKDINYIGIEKYASPLLLAAKRIEKPLPNLKLICYDAFLIDELFLREISKIYLTFSDPWPKKRHEKRRLTSLEFLKKYDSVFKDKKVIELKTDNVDFFEYSVISMEEYGYNIVSLDTKFNDDIKTEYEEKFINKGININHVIVIK